MKKKPTTIFNFEALSTERSQDLLIDGYSVREKFITK